MEIKLNKTQLEITGTVLGYLSFIPNRETIFIKYIAPLILENPVDIISYKFTKICLAIIILLPFIGLFDLIRRIIKTTKMMDKQRLTSYFINLGIAIIISILIALFLNRVIFS